jgi:ABC-type branched-subunit amino acid transport system substrate-binding protein
VTTLGPGATFLQPEDTAMKAVAAQINNKGGICGRKLELILHDSGWKAPSGAALIENMILAENVFLLAVNPDSEGLNAVSVAPYGNGKLAQWKVPVVGTDGLLFSQYLDPYIWPIAASTATAMHAMAKSQYTTGSRKFGIVYEQTYRFGREGAKAYNNQVKALTGKDIPGYSDPDTNPKCQGAFCGIQSSSGQASYGSEANTISGCCDGGAVLLEPATAIQWFKSGGTFGGVASPAGGAGASPQPLFQRYFADGCQRTCNGMRLWTGFLPPIGDFATQPAVAQYVNTMKGYSSSVDVNNQFAEGAYVGMQLTVQVLAAASTGPGGLTRANVISVLNNTQNWNNGLTVAPLSWSASNHFSLSSVHAFDELYPSGFGGWQFVRGSATQDPQPGKI